MAVHVPFPSTSYSERTVVDCCDPRRNAVMCQHDHERAATADREHGAATSTLSPGTVALKRAVDSAVMTGSGMTAMQTSPSLVVHVCGVTNWLL